MMFYDGYQFLYRKAVWRCRDFYPNTGKHLEPRWTCVSDTDEVSSFGVSEIALYPQVMTGPAFRPTADPGAGHPGEPGSRGRYTKGCRCPQCRAANAAYMKRRRNRG